MLESPLNPPKARIVVSNLKNFGSQNLLDFRLPEYDVIIQM